MAPNLFSVPLFFIIFRETLEASIIISVLLSLVENLFDRSQSTQTTLVEGEQDPDAETPAQRKHRLVRRMKLQIWAGAGTGLLIAVCIGAAFIAVFFTTLSDIWAQSEELWEGSFSLVACIIIFVMGITMLRIDRSKLKWRAKLENAFDPKVPTKDGDKKNVGGKSGKWTLFLIPMITVLREGLEAVVFVGGVSLGQPATSIPIATIVGLACGLIVGYLIYASSSRVNLSIFLVISTNILFLLGAGLLSKAVGAFERYKYIQEVGAAVAESGDGPGSFDVDGNVWHMAYGNPENKLTGEGWGVFSAVLGWNNNATYGTILSYCFYWLAVIVALVYMKWSEGRFNFFGHKSAAGKRREARRIEKDSQGSIAESDEMSEMKSQHEESAKAVDHVPVLTV